MEAATGEGRRTLTLDPAAAAVSCYALGRDYHKLMRLRLQRLAGRIAEQTGGRYWSLDDAAKLPVIVGSAPASIKREDFAKAGARVLLQGHQPVAAAVKALQECYSHLFKGGAPAAVALLSGEIHSIFAPLIEALPHIRSGAFKALAVCGKKRSPMVPNVPVISDLLPGYETSSWGGISAPAKTPTEIVNRLSMSLAKVLTLPASKAHFSEADKEPVGSTPAEFGGFLKDQLAIWKQAVIDAKVTEEETDRIDEVRLELRAQLEDRIDATSQAADDFEQKFSRLIGMDSVKSELRKRVDFLIVNKRRAGRGLPASRLSL